MKVICVLLGFACGALVAKIAQATSRQQCEAALTALDGRQR